MFHRAIGSSPISDLFDHTGAVRRPPLRRLAREFRALFDGKPQPLEPVETPSGDGRGVLIIPAFLTNDGDTAALRQFLDAHGFRSFGWDQGVNWGPTPRILAGLRTKLTELCQQTGGPVSVVGISLGGLLAVDLAHDCPEQVSQVVTLASPLRLPTASSMEALIRLCGLSYSAGIQPERLALPLPIPSTAFFTRDDGIIAWESCRLPPGANGVNIEVTGAHVTISRNPELRRLLVRCLAAV
jgi:pimeloyl-ACP methyl ester carboxylesterase